MSRNNLGALADDLGRIKAAIADLEKQETALKTEIVASGHDAIEGDLFRVTISKSTRETLDMAAVRAKLTPQFISSHTNYTHVTTVRCVARTGKEEAA